MLTYRVRNIGIAAALALLAAMFTFFYVSNYKRHVQQGEELVDVYVASHDISVGESGAEVAGGLTHKRVARQAVVPGAISDPSQIQKLVATQPIFTGEQVEHQALPAGRGAGHPRPVAREPRALEVPGDGHQLLARARSTTATASTLSATGRSPRASRTHVSRVVLRDIKVLHDRREWEVAEQARRLGQRSIRRDHRRLGHPVAQALLAGEERRVDAPAAPGREGD